MSRISNRITQSRLPHSAVRIPKDVGTRGGEQLPSSNMSILQEVGSNIGRGRVVSCAMSPSKSGLYGEPLRGRTSGCQPILDLENGRWTMSPTIGSVPVRANCVSRRAAMARCPVALMPQIKRWCAFLSPQRRSRYSGPSFQPRLTPSSTVMNSCRESDVS